MTAEIGKGKTTVIDRRYRGRPFAKRDANAL